MFLFDEALPNLDAALRMDMRMEIGKLHKQLGATMIHVTLDQVAAMPLADKIVVLKDGLVQQIGAPMELYHHPANLFVAGFTGSPAKNFLEVDIREVSGNRVTVSNAALGPVTIVPQTGSYTAGGKAKLGLRPQYLHPASDAVPGRLHGTIALVERHGAETMRNLTLTDGTTLIAALGHDAAFDLGTRVDPGFDAGQAHLFPADQSAAQEAH